MSDEKYYHIAEAYANVEVDADLDADADADPEVNAADADDQSTVGDMYRATPVHQYSPGSSASDSDSDASAARPSAPHTSDAAPSSAPRRHPAVPSGRKGRDVAASGGVTSRTPKSAGIDTQEARKRQRERENNLVKAREAAARNRASGGRKTAVQSLQLPYRIVKKIMKIDDEVLTVHNESAILMANATEIFIEHLGQVAHNCAQDRGRSLIRYEDVVEARSSSDALEFLETLLR